MNIKDFAASVDKTILQRGLEYYKNGYIESLDFDGEEWVATVSGSDDYTITVKLNDSGDIISTDCDCPYDWGRYCKHQAAVFYALCKELANPNNKSKNAPKVQYLEEVLNHQDKAVLIKALLDYSKQDRHIKQDLLYRFTEKDKDITEYARNIIKTSIKRVMRRGFVEYDDVEKAVEGANKILKMAEAMIDDILPCISLCSVILEEMIELFDNCEDYEDIYDVISGAVELIKDAAEIIPDDFSGSDTEKVFDLIFVHASSGQFSGSDWKNDLLYVCVPFCRMQNIRKKFEEYLLSAQGYNKQKFQNILRDIIERFDGIEAADAYIDQNLENSDFRRIAVQKALNENRFDRALKLCADGEISDASYAGLVSQWKEIRYSVYEKQNDTENQKNLAYEFVLDGKFEYFLKLKQLYSSDEWEEILYNLLNVLKSNRGRSIYVDIIVHEKKQQLLLEYCETHISAIADLYKHLLPEYSFEVEMIFVDYIRLKAQNSSDRNQYRDVCSIIKHYKNACGNQKAVEIKNELLQSYHKRPAFKDELNKLKE